MNSNRFQLQLTPKICSVPQMCDNCAILQSNCYITILQKKHFISFRSGRYDDVSWLIEFTPKTSNEIRHEIRISGFEERNLHSLIEGLFEYDHENLLHIFLSWGLDQWLVLYDWIISIWSSPFLWANDNCDVGDRREELLRVVARFLLHQSIVLCSGSQSNQSLVSAACEVAFYNPYIRSLQISFFVRKDKNVLIFVIQFIDYLKYLTNEENKWTD